MLLTEQEALHKSCCNKIEQHDRCIGKCCMAWRWSLRWGDRTRKGYCGLAGKPEDEEDI